MQRQLDEEAELKAARKERNLRIIFSCLMCGAVVIITIILFIVSKVSRLVVGSYRSGLGLIVVG